MFAQTRSGNQASVVSHKALISHPWWSLKCLFFQTCTGRSKKDQITTTRSKRDFFLISILSFVFNFVNAVKVNKKVVLHWTCVEKLFTLSSTFWPLSWNFTLSYVDFNLIFSKCLFFQRCLDLNTVLHRCAGFYFELTQWPPVAWKENKKMYNCSEYGTFSKSLRLSAGRACRARLLMFPHDYRRPNLKIWPLSASHLEPQVVTWLASACSPQSC